MDRQSATDGTYPHGSRSRTRSQRWEEDRTKCIPDFCIYAHACPQAGGRAHYVPKVQCYRCLPEERRPPAGLSKLAIELLERCRGPNRPQGEL